MMLGWIAFLIMGIVLGLIGGGGSILTVPILVYFFSLNATQATGASLFVVGSTALVGAMVAFFKNEVKLTESLPFVLPSLAGVFIARSFLLPWTPDPIWSFRSLSFSKDIFLMCLFAILMLTASAKMIFSQNLITEKKSASIIKVSAQGFLVGLVTGFIGAGGGFLIIPGLIFFLNFKMREASATSLLIIAMNSAVGLLSDLIVNHNKPWFLLLMASGIATFGLFVGRRLGPYFSEVALKKIFGWFVFILGSGIFLDQIGVLRGFF